MKHLLFPVILLTVMNNIIAQPAKDSSSNPDSVSKTASKAYQDSIEKVYLSTAIYPLIKTSKWSGVVPVNNADEFPDKTQQYKLLMEISQGTKDSVEAKEINESIAEVGRLINIHIAAGIPQKNITVVAVAHGTVLRALFNNAAYREKYKIDNPNIPVLNELLAAGVKFIACGQAMLYFGVNKTQLLPAVKVALSAQSELTNYQLKGYVLKTVQTK